MSAWSYRVDETGFTTTLTFSPELLLCLGIVCVAVGLAGVWCLTKPVHRRGGVAIIAVAMLAGLVVVPAMSDDRVQITETHAEQITRPFFSPRVNRIDYSLVDFVTIREVYSRRSTSRVWFVHQTNGAIEEIDFGDLWENNEAFIVRKLRNYGVRFR
jgi:hypothetical protein